MRLHRITRVWATAGVVLLAALMSGCTGGAAPSDGSTHGPEAGAAPNGSASPRVLRFGGRYRLPPEHAQWERIYQEQLEQYVIDHESRGLTDPPTDASFVRFVEPTEFGAVQAACLAEQGFSVTVTFDGGVDFGDYPSEQTPALLAATFRCDVQYPVHPRYGQKPTETQIRVIYDYTVSALVPCLGREGYVVDQESIPTWETFLATFQQDGSWSAYDVVIKKHDAETVANGGVAPKGQYEEWERINKTCPQEPPLDQLWPKEK